MKDYETEVTSGDAIDSEGDPSAPARPIGRGWRFVGVYRAERSGGARAIWYWERDVDVAPTPEQALADVKDALTPTEYAAFTKLVLDAASGR